MSTAHIEIDELADKAAGLVAPERAAEIDAHLADCDACAALAARLATVSDSLLQLPGETMPDEVASRIDAALATERGQAATVLPMKQARSARGVRWASFSAAAAVIALVVAVVISHNAASGPSKHPSADHPALTPSVSAAALQRVEHGTGVAYSSTNIVGQVSQQLRHPPAPLQAAIGKAAVQLPAAKKTSNRPKTNGTFSAAKASVGVPTALHALMQPKRLLACIAQIYAPDPVDVPPISIDFATYDGKPAAIVLIHENETDDLAYVVGPGCGTLRKDTPVSAPSPSMDLITYQEIPVG